MTAYKRWLSDKFLATPIRGNEIGMKGPNGERVAIIIHHAFEKIRECVVKAAPHRPKLGVLMYLRMNYNEKDAIKLSKKSVSCDVEEGDILGVFPNQVKDGNDQNRIYLDYVQDEELYMINYSSVFYTRKPDSDKIKLRPGWVAIHIDKKTETKLGELILLNQAINDKPIEGTIRYVSEGPDGTKECLGLEVGDEVYFAPEMNIAMEINGEALFMVAHSQIQAKKL